MSEEQVIERQVQITSTGARDLALTMGLYEEAYKSGRNLSLQLEEVDPSAQYRNDPEMAGLDAFQRQMRFAGIIPETDLSRGIYADKVEKFWASKKKGSEILFLEWMARKWRSISYGQFSPAMSDEAQKRFYMSSDPVSDVLYPSYIQGTMRARQIQPSLPLSILVAVTTPIDSGVYEAFYLTEDEAERQMPRVGEGAEVPTAKLTGSDHTIRVRKYGRRLVGSYETFRRMRIDRFATHLALLAVQAEVDKVARALDVLVNGDGNANTAATSFNKTTLDADLAAGDPISVEAYLNWRMQWASPYNCQVVVGNAARILDLLLTNAGTANTLLGQMTGLFGIGGMAPVNGLQLSTIQYAWDSNAAANTLIGVDNRFALELVTEIGSSLVETNKVVTAQFNEIVMTESLGFAIFDQNATKLMVTNA